MNLGYACINLQLWEQGISCNKGMIRKTFLEKGKAYASELAFANVQAFLNILEWNAANGITLFRMSSDLFPWSSEYRLDSLPHFKEIRTILEAAGKLPVRVTTHPGPFNKMAGEGKTLENTIHELETHSLIFDLMGLEPSRRNKINIHIGGAYGDKQETIKRFARNMNKLSSGLRKRLTVENDDKPGLFSIAELKPLHEMTGLPLVFDYFHHQLHPGGLSEEEAFHYAYNTWDELPVFHYSNSRKVYEDPECKKEAHSDWLYERVNTYGRPLDIMLETKMKERSLQRYRISFDNANIKGAEAPL
ncbi:MAG: UV DNA damage repair endonuclease UvsE [Sphingobacteriales bacterium]|nr:MAG: UV DNA damage repair endonuclease UvsE [Sphingobacteriales bacterium]